MARDVPSKPKSERPKEKHGDAAAPAMAAKPAVTPATSETMDSAVAKETASTDPQRWVDRWFDRQLVSLYGEVADEPVPDEILNLVRKLTAPN